ncbi:MAG: SoxR reducing system RseC family protein [Candidatus Cloacimonetes bacterium]|nr:SoxR reducing system RseC family protein [Candidatus Cloacimonadota bacterium]
MNMDDTQEDVAVVISTEKGKVTVEIDKSDSCDSCAIRGLCMSKGSSVRHTLETDIKLSIGDHVRVSASAGVKLLSSFILFILPIMMMIVFYFIAKLIGFSEDVSIITSIAGLLVSILIIRLLDKRFANKIHFEIIEKIELPPERTHENTSE